MKNFKGILLLIFTILLISFFITYISIIYTFNKNNIIHEVTSIPISLIYKVAEV